MRFQCYWPIQELHYRYPVIPCIHPVMIPFTLRFRYIITLRLRDISLTFTFTLVTLRFVTFRWAVFVVIGLQNL